MMVIMTMMMAFESILQGFYQRFSLLVHLRLLIALYDVQDWWASLVSIFFFFHLPRHSKWIAYKDMSGSLY